MKKPVIIGCGNMGSAVIEALIQRGIFDAASLSIVEKLSNPYVERFEGQGATILKRIEDLGDNLELVIMAIKPQDAPQALRLLGAKSGPETLLISVMAGISISEMEAHAPGTQIIRCMPNTPCSLQQGMIVYCGNASVAPDSFKLAQQILGALGKAFQVTEEIMIDAATAISGSGPAYVFYLAEALKEGAAGLGFSEEHADILARQTLLGAAMLLDHSDDSPEELRRKVTSPGGTTEAALNSFAADNVKDLLIKGFQVAYDRSLELGKN